MVIKEEKDKNNTQSLGVDSFYSISKQLPFFCCPNVLYEPEVQTIIDKYFYCKEFGIPPHKGDYLEQPSKWISQVFIIKNCLTKLEQIQRERTK